MTQYLFIILIISAIAVLEKKFSLLFLILTLVGPYFIFVDYLHLIQTNLGKILFLLLIFLLHFFIPKLFNTFKIIFGKKKNPF